MNRSTIISFALVFALGLGLCIATAGQEPNTHHFPTPPETMDPENRNVQSPTGPRRNIDLVQVQREADDLARTAQTIPSDVAKQIERLSKHLRAQLNP